MGRREVIFCPFLFYPKVTLSPNTGCIVTIRKEIIIYLNIYEGTIKVTGYPLPMLFSAIVLNLKNCVPFARKLLFVSYIENILYIIFLLFQQKYLFLNMV